MPVEIPTDIEHFKLVFRFEVSDESAILKIDQHVGDFTDPVSGNILPEADGLSLLLTPFQVTPLLVNLVMETISGLIHLSLRLLLMAF
ncbi:MAG: hypothetical protein ACW968_15665 [Candidatus Thorarchaeota archaeon]